jgi:hypothetical protein
MEVALIINNGAGTNQLQRDNFYVAMGLKSRGKLGLLASSNTVLAELESGLSREKNS